MWQKIDFNYHPSKSLAWSNSHATVPTPLHLKNDIFRVFFSTRDELNRNRVGWVEIELGTNVKILNESNKYVLDIGKPGYFDCDGVYGTSIIKTHNELRLYYAGWNAGKDGLFYSSIGLAISKNYGRSFKRFSEAPILTRDEIDPWACMAPFVLRINKKKWMMWYASGIEICKASKGGLKSKYDIKTAISPDGLKWKKTGRTAISLGSKDTNIARACVLREKDKFIAWYPYVSKKLKKYSIGYGESYEGLKFKRLDKTKKAILKPSKNLSAFDSDSVCYPYVFHHKENLYMLYNGNDFGKTGFGIARWKE